MEENCVTQCEEKTKETDSEDAEVSEDCVETEGVEEELRIVMMCEEESKCEEGREDTVKKNEGEGSPRKEIMHICLAEGERRGWWIDHEPPKKEAVQAFVHGAVEDLGLPLMLDTGANISLLHTDLARRLGLSVRMFDDSNEFYGVSEDPIPAHGKATVKVKLGEFVVYEMEFWVADFDAHSLVIVGTDFMVRAGLVVDLGRKHCQMPEEDALPLLSYEDLKAPNYLKIYEEVKESRPKPLKWSSEVAVACVGDVPPAIFVVDGLTLDQVDQSKLAQEVYIHEGVEMSVENMKEQLALIPEFDDQPTQEVNMDEADIGELETTEEEKVQTRKILEAKKDGFISSGNALPPPAKGVVCDVDVGDAKPIAQKARRVPPELLGRLYELLRGLLRAGLIRYSNSPWASAIVIVLKKNGKDIRLCIDYRMVNLLTKLMVYAMPLVDDLLDNFDSIMWFCSLDNASGFWAINLTTRARLVTAFICPLGHFEWTRMPQGLKNAPQIYQRMIDNALWSAVRRLSSRGVGCKTVGWSECELIEEESKFEEQRIETDVALKDDVFRRGVPQEDDIAPVIHRRSYIDDITFGAVSWSQMNVMLECLLDAFKYWGVTVSLRKSAFGKKSVEFLSHTISREGVKTAPRNLQSVLDMPFPSTQKGIQKFIGSLVYYHRFIDNFATYAAALYEITDLKLRDGTQLDHAKAAFEALKERLSHAPMLKHIDRKRELVIVLYTNKWAFGASVCQEHDGVLHPVRFVSKVFKDTETRYTPAEQEVLALLKTLHAASHYLLGQPITVYARYSTMKWVFTSKSLTGRTIQWAAMLSPWTLKIVRSDETPVGLVALLAASVVLPERMDEVLEEISPMRRKKDTPVIRPLPDLRRSTPGHVLTFDGAVRVKEPKIGSFGMILWKLPEWKIVAAAYDAKPDLTVNDSEYNGLLGALELARDHGIREGIVCGDSRIVIGQVNGDLRCNQPSLQVWLNRAKVLLQSFDGVSFIHIARKYNQSADLLTRRGMTERAAGVVEDQQQLEDLVLLNTLPELLYRTSDEGMAEEEEDSPELKEPTSVDYQEARVDVITLPDKACEEKPRGVGLPIKPPSMYEESENPNENVERQKTHQVFALRIKKKAGAKKARTGQRATELPEGGNVEEAAVAAKEWSPLHVSDEMLTAAQTERFKRIAAAQRRDEWCRLVIMFLEGDVDEFPSSTAVKKIAKTADLFVLDAADVLYYCPQGRDANESTMRLVVPDVLQRDLLYAYHEELGAGAHQGVGRVFERMRRLYYWRGMFADVEWYVGSCEDCATAKGKPRYKGRSEGNVTATRPFQVLAMDFAIPLPKTYNGNEAMLCCICLFTSYVILIPMADTSAQSVAEAYLAGVFKRFGAQEMIRHDRDPRFMSSVFKRFNRMMNQKQRPTLAYRPQANGKQERSIQTVVRAVKCYISDPEQKDWDEYVNQLELALNTSVNLQHKQTPFYLVHGWNARTQLEAAIPPKDGTVKEKNALEWRQKICKEHERAMAEAELVQQKLIEKRVKTNNDRVAEKTQGTARTEYQPGELVWLYHVLIKEGLTRKLSHLWHGPYQVIERVNESVYRLKIDKSESRVLPMIHISRLKPFVSRMRRPRERVEPAQDLELDEALLPEDSWFEQGADGEFEVEAILDCKYIKRTRNGRRQRQYRVKWLGFDDPTWEPEENLSCTALLYEFDARRAWENRQAAAQTAQEEEEEEDLEEEAQDV